MKLAASTGVLVKTLFMVLFWVMVAAFVFLFMFGDFFSCFDIHSRWFMLMVADFTAFTVVIVAWVFYKEANWTIAIVIFLSMYILGCLVSLGYILTQFYKLSNEEYLNDPLYFVLARRQKRVVNGGSLVVVARVFFSILGFLVLGALVYTVIDELSPSYAKCFVSCFIPFEIDLYIHIAIFSVWIAYKEPSWASTLFWIVLLVCFKGVTLCAYILRQLFDLSPEQPASLIIFNNTNRDLQSTDPLLMEHPNQVS